MHDPRCITSGSSPLVHHLWPHPWSRLQNTIPQLSTPHNLAGFTLSYSHAVTPSKYHTFCCALKTLSLIIALNLEDGHRPNLLVLLSNHLIPNDYTVDHRPNLLVQLCNHLILNDYTVERSRRRSFHCLSGKNLVQMKNPLIFATIPPVTQLRKNMELQE